MREHGRFNLNVPTPEYVGTEEEALLFLQELLALATRNPGMAFGFDTETHGLKIPLPGSKKKPLDWMRDTVVFWSVSFHDGNEYRRFALPGTLLHLFVPFFENPNVLLVVWNLKYDAHVCFNSGVDLWCSGLNLPSGGPIDVQAMGYLVDENLQGDMGLKARCAEGLVSVYDGFYETELELRERGGVFEGDLVPWEGLNMTKFTDLFGYKDAITGKRIEEHKTSLLDLAEQNLAKVVDYASLDAYAHLKMFEHARSLLERTICGARDGTRTMWQYFLEMETAVTCTLWRMERRGIPIDVEYLRGLVEPIVTEIEAIQKEINKVMGRPINLASHPQKVRMFFGAKEDGGLGLKPIKMTKGGERGQAPAVDEEVLSILAMRGINIAELVVRYSSLAKTLSTNIQTIIFLACWYKDGRLHPQFNQFGARTGRFCLAKGSMVETVRDVSTAPAGTPIERVRAGDLVYSYDDARRLCVRRVLWSGRTGRKQVMRVHWRGTGHKREGHLDLTLEHEVRLTDGTYKRAKDLRLGDHILAVSRDVDAFGYARLYSTGTRGYRKEHQFLYEENAGCKPQVVHHINGNKLDNRLENLEATTPSEHSKHHSSNRSAELNERVSAALKKAWKEGRMTKRPRKRAVSLAHLRGFNQRTFEKLPRKHNWSITQLSRSNGYDFITMKKYAVALGFDLQELKDKHLEYRQKHGLVGRYAAQSPELPNNHMVVGLELLKERCDVYDIEVEDTHNFIANELCVHNSSSNINSMNLPRPDTDEFKIRRAFIADQTAEEFALALLGLWDVSCLNDEEMANNAAEWIAQFNIKAKDENIPRKARRHIKSLAKKEVRRLGKKKRKTKLIIIDYEQLEMRVLAHFCGDEAMVKAINDGLDMHCVTVSRMFPGVTYEEVKAAKKAKDAHNKETDPPLDARILQLVRWRQEAKTIGFALVYGAGAKNIAGQLGIEKEEAQEKINLFFAAYPRVKEFIEETIDACYGVGYVETLVGRLRRLPQIWSSQFINRAHAERESVNSIIQGSGADMIKAGMLNCEFNKRLRELECFIINQIHDELVFECPEENCAEAMPIIKECLEHPFEKGVNPLIVDSPCSIGDGDNWEDCK